jgi:hypothetical protein
MRRLHLVEIQDLESCPEVIRDGVTDILRVLIENSRLSDAMADKVEECLEDTKAETLVDLGSGGGGPVLSIAQQLRERGHSFRWIMTDQFPNKQVKKLIDERGITGLEYGMDPVDATDVPGELDGFRTMFNCLHHFRPDEVREIFRDAAQSSQPILAVEMPGRNFASFTSLLMAPIFSLVMRPLVRPIQLSKWVLTYFVPVIPLVLLWDSIVSGLRAYSVEHLREITAEVDGMNWDVGRWSPEATYWGSITYVYGTPVRTS